MFLSYYLDNIRNKPDYTYKPKNADRILVISVEAICSMCANLQVLPPSSYFGLFRLLQCITSRISLSFFFFVKYTNNCDKRRKGILNCCYYFYCFFFFWGDESNKSGNIEWNLWNFYECSIEISILSVIFVLKDNSLDRE